MFNDKLTKQEGGDGSTNLQSQSITINNGLSYQDAKDIALDVFKSNYLQLSENAAKVARERAEQLIDNFLIGLQERKPEAIISMETPGMQYAVFTAQKEYAKAGDQGMLDMLVDILIERANTQERSLEQIVLDECLEVLPKLTTAQLDTLTIIFMITQSKGRMVKDIISFYEYFKNYVAPFTENLSKNPSVYQHLIYTGCTSSNHIESQIEQVIRDNYGVVFCKGFKREDLSFMENDLEKISSILVQSFHDPTKLQFSLSLKDNGELLLDDLILDENVVRNINKLIRKHTMPSMVIRQILLNNGEYMKKLYNAWDSPLKNMSLPSVGIAIAGLNLKMKTGESINLNIWIK